MRDRCILGFLLSLLFVVSFCNADGNTFEVVGAGECADCDNFKTSQVFSGLHVSVDCKLKTGETKRIGSGKLDKVGNFKINIPSEIIVQSGQELKEECYAQLHNSAAAPCPAHDGLEAAKIIFKSQTDKKITFVPTKNVRFSSALCSSKFAWPYFKHPKSYTHWKKKFPKINFPPIKNFLHPFPPLYKPKPIPPLIPVYNPPVVPIYKPKLKPPVYKPKPPVVKPLPPHVPVYKPKPPVVKPLLPPHVPIYKPKPKPPVYKPTPKPKPMPPSTPVFPFPFHKKKPCPPFPKIPKKHFFHHPKFGHFPPLPPFSIPQP